MYTHTSFCLASGTVSLLLGTGPGISCLAFPESPDISFSGGLNLDSRPGNAPCEVFAVWREVVCMACLAVETGIVLLELKANLGLYSRICLRNEGNLGGMRGIKPALMSKGSMSTTSFYIFSTYIVRKL